jgi:hypothetical protein
VSRIKIADNPEYAGKTPRPLKATCHDGTPFLTVVCAAGHENHVHESQLPPLPEPISMRCAVCRRTIEFDGGEIEAAFQKMRDDGWIE